MSLRLLVVAALVGLAACSPGSAEPPATPEAVDPEPVAAEAGDPQAAVSEPPPSPITPTTTGRTTTTTTAPTSTTEPAATATPNPTTTLPGIATVTADDLGSSWRPGCPVDPTDLRAVTVAHRTFGGGTAEGTIIVHADVATDVLAVFERLWDLGFPLERVVPVDRFGSSDDASMAANNTSGFNCRPTTGGSRWSEHAYGRAIDLNPVQNPYVRGTTILPPAGSAYLDRTFVAPGMVTPEVVAAFAAAGWSWGGDWSSPDYQHFSTSGR